MFLNVLFIKYTLNVDLEYSFSCFHLVLLDRVQCCSTKSNPINHSFLVIYKCLANYDSHPRGIYLFSNHLQGLIMTAIIVFISSQ